MMTKVTEFEVIDHGIHNPSYFQGCGTSFTQFKYVMTGVGDNPNEALEDAFEQIANVSENVDTEDLFARIIAENGNNQFPELPSAYDNMMNDNGFGPSHEPDEDDEEAHEKWEESRESFDGESYESYYHISIRYNV